MKLKKLIISGFKSFADKVTLSFGDGITGVVGPNGSGKSNVIDAVRWVMGEQSVKHLRGSVATDIIFAGSDKRKQLGMAEVTLIFDNTEFSDHCPPEYRNDPEIALGRRLYIDGQREYFINRKPCRLKDIVGFFTLTGLGGRSYSMIQQGQVDRILNSKPEDVRLILEEAAGTLVYKNRRDAAEKKLLATQENLSRIDDIITELERQLNTLESQVDKARQYRSLSEELHATDLKLLSQNYYEFNSKERELDELVESNQDQETLLTSQMAKLEARAVSLQVKLQEADPEMEELRERVSEVREAIARAESQITSAFVKIEGAENRLEDMANNDEEDNVSLDMITRDRKTVEKDIALLEEQKVRLEDEMEGLTFDLEQREESAMVFKSKEDQIKGSLANLDLLLETNALRSEAIDRDRRKAVNEIQESEHKLTVLEGNLQEAQESVTEAQENVDTNQSQIADEIAAKAELDHKIKELSGTRKQLKATLADLREQQITATTKKQSLESFLAANTGITETLESIKALDANADRYCLGLVTDKITVKPDQTNQQSKSLLAAFSAWSERIVVPDTDGLSQLSDFAAKSQLPRVPLSVLNAATDNAALASWLATTKAQPIKNLIAADPSVAPLIERLYFTDQTTQVDAEFIQKVPPGITVFTSSGLIINSQNDFVIESPSHHGILAQKSEVTALNEQLIALEIEIVQATAQISQIDEERNQLQASADELDNQIKAQNSSILEHIKNLQIAKQNLEYKRNSLVDAEKQLDHHQSSLEMFTKELENLGEARIALGQEREQLNMEAEDLQGESTDIVEQAAETRRVFDSKKLDLTQIETQLQSKNERLEQYDRQLDMMQNSSKRKEDEKKRIEAEIEAARIEEKNIAEDIQTKIVEREELEEKLQVRRSANAELVEQIRAVEEELKDTRNQHGKLIKLKSNKSLELERIKIALDGIKEQAQERYQLDITKIEIIPDAEFDTAAASRRIQTLRGQIEKLGAINMMAIEEFDKLKERYDFIKEQKEEVNGSIALLEEAISEIEETAKMRFLETYETINYNFADLFPVLFPGGDARLHLTDENDPLNGGVDILVRLPGKKQRSMMLFSGGEKALTAISLIFALLKTKPTPFCFLDEVDAPLDEANVGRYNAVLEHLAHRFQFVVITHNRRTMEVLDQLYGVTMQEGGVSKVVGVDMKKDLPAHLRKALDNNAVANQ